MFSCDLTCTMCLFLLIFWLSYVKSRKSRQSHFLRTDLLKFLLEPFTLRVKVFNHIENRI